MHEPEYPREPYAADPRAYDEPNAVDLMFKHPLTGPIVLVVVFAVLFQIVFIACNPIASAIDSMLVSLADKVGNQLVDGPLRSLLTDGLIRGAGCTLMFLPHMALVFIVVTLLRKAGYFGELSWFFEKAEPNLFSEETPISLPTPTDSSDVDQRGTVAAGMLDRLFSGRLRLAVGILAVAAFVPNERIAAGFISVQGLSLAVLLLASVLIALSLRGFLLDFFRAKSEPPELREQARYNLPNVFTLLQENAWDFALRTGRLLASMSVLVWALAYYPHGDGNVAPELIQQREELVQQITAADVAEAATVASKVAEELAKVDQRIDRQRLQVSYLGRLGSSLKSVSTALGWDWRFTSSALTAFPVPHAAVGNCSMLGHLGEQSETISDTIQGMTESDAKTRVLKLPAALSLVAFLFVWAPTASTCGMLFRENKATWAIGVVLVMTLLAVGAAWITRTVALEAVGS